ncbi:10686_t:CDS:2, partial [Acaulospora colombiana]
NGPSALLVVTTYPDCSALIVEYSAEERALVVKETHKLVSPYGLPLAGCNPCAVSADRQYAAISLYQGIMHILQFTRKSGSIQVSLKFECQLSVLWMDSLRGKQILTTINNRIPELLMSSFCFTPRINGELMVALLHRSHTGRRHIVTRRIDEINKELPPGSESWILGEDEFKSLIPILPSQGGYGGLLVLGEDTLAFYELSPPKISQSPRRMRKQSVAAERKPDVILDWNYSIIAGDKYGKLILLTMLRSRESKKIHNMAIDDLGETKLVETRQFSEYAEVPQAEFPGL